jgi:hypothetical protein
VKPQAKLRVTKRAFYEVMNATWGKLLGSNPSASSILQMGKAANEEENI